jgi:superfamily I DNA and/or RNA helicase
MLVGDHHQLSPFTTWDEAEKYKYDVSLLKVLMERLPHGHNMMTIQYRMHKDIAKIVSDTFYSKKLTTGAIKREFEKSAW